MKGLKRLRTQHQYIPALLHYKHKWLSKPNHHCDPFPMTTKIVVFITCSLKYDRGTLENHKSFTPLSFLNQTKTYGRKKTSASSSNNQNQQVTLKILNWNARGAGSTDFRGVFRDLITTHRPDIIILTETGSVVIELKESQNPLALKVTLKQMRLVLLEEFVDPNDSKI